MNTRGIWIAFEGPDGAGKTTALEEVYRRLIDQGYDVVKTREPGGTPVSEQIREIILHQYCHPRCEMLLFAAARAHHIEHFIKPMLDLGKIVLCDRFSMSTYAYQQVARGLGPDVTMLDEFARQGAWPDFVAYFDVEVEEGIRRLSLRAAANGKSDRIDQEGLDFKRRVNEGFKKAYDEQLFKNVYRVDANMSQLFVNLQVNSWLEWDVLPYHTGENMPMFGYPDRPDLSEFVTHWLSKAYREPRNPKLAGVDPYDPHLSDETKLQIVEECRHNPPYFFRTMLSAVNKEPTHAPLQSIAHGESGTASSAESQDPGLSVRGSEGKAG